MLPYPKDEIKAAIKTLLVIDWSIDKTMKANFQRAYSALAFFIDDEDAAIFAALSEKERRHSLFTAELVRKAGYMNLEEAIQNGADKLSILPGWTQESETYAKLIHSPEWDKHNNIRTKI